MDVQNKQQFGNGHFEIEPPKWQSKWHFYIYIYIYVVKISHYCKSYIYVYTRKSSLNKLNL